MKQKKAKALEEYLIASELTYIQTKHYLYEFENESGTSLQLLIISDQAHFKFQRESYSFPIIDSDMELEISISTTDILSVRIGKYLRKIVQKVQSDRTIKEGGINISEQPCFNQGWFAG
ncbi:MAG: hypothetical protein GY828_06540 [Candidatus Gracilibacteria bacterium]|nr:hypothetical protein [Candidatus Gracilibacteria bacterium]